MACGRGIMRKALFFIFCQKHNLKWNRVDLVNTVSSSRVRYEHVHLGIELNQSSEWCGSRYCGGPRGVCGVRLINTHCGVIVDPSRSPLSCHREALPTDDRQTGSVWLGYAEQTLAATWWLDRSYICSLHQHQWRPWALGVWLSFLAPSATIFFLLFLLLLKL